LAVSLITADFINRSEGTVRYRPLPLKPPVWRASRKGEISKILLNKIDLKAKRIELPGRTTKGKKPRFLPIYGDMAAELSMAISLAHPNCPFLVQEKAGALRIGKRVGQQP
jgi:hypothetical protein